MNASNFSAIKIFMKTNQKMATYAKGFNAIMITNFFGLP